MEIFRAGRTVAAGPAEWLTGRVRVDAPFNAADPARSTGIARRAATAMSPIAIQQVGGGKVVGWLEHVSDADHGA